MKKRILSYLLALCLIMPNLSMPVFAAEETKENISDAEDEVMVEEQSKVTVPEEDEDNGTVPADECAKPEAVEEADVDPDIQPQSSSGEGEVVSDSITYGVRLDADAKTADIYKVQNVPEGVTGIAIPSMVTCDGMDYTVTRISLSAFSSNKYTGVTELTLPDTLTDVSGSFITFPNLSAVTIPGSVKTFNGSFQNMGNLEIITFADGVEEIKNGSIVSNCSALKTIHLPNTLKRISGTGTFSNAPALENITLPEGVQVLEGSLFSGDTALKSVELPASITEIKYSMFENCTSLESVTARGIITSVEQGAFSKATNLQTIPDLGNVKTVGAYAFYNCTSLRQVPDLKNVTTMGRNAFEKCSALSGALDLSSLDQIPKYAFSYDSCINSVKLSDHLTSIGDWAFLGCDLETIEFPETLTSIGPYAFWYASKLTGEIRIPDSVTTISNHAFAETNLEKINIGSGVKEIDANVFADNPSLKEIVFNNSKDDVKITGDLPADVTVTYLVESIDDHVGDRISDRENAPTLQDAVNAAARTEGQGTVILEKHIKLDKPVTVPAGNTVTILANDPFMIAGVETAQLYQLFEVEEGASIIFGKNIKLFGRYNNRSVIQNHGTTELQEGAIVTGSTLESDSTGVIDSSGKNARFILNGGVIEHNVLKENVSYSGVVRVSDGASVEIRSGSIQNNVALDADGLNSSSGLLLSGNSSGIMTGGTIQNNQGRRGSAVMLLGHDDDNRTEFVLEGGQIQKNKCISAGSVDASGAVHVESNASFTMSGGSISENKGVKGAGVCVVDGNLQIGAPEYGTAFIMNGGSISKNTGSTGGGIYSYSNGVTINKGEITDNTAFGLGGGIYSEGNETYYSTLHLTNALITENTARQGGGMWFCATGRTNVYVTDGAALFGNTATDVASGKAAGDDFVFSAFANNTSYLATLSDRMLGGGAVQWYRDGGVYIASLGGSSYPSTDKNCPRYEEMEAKEQIQGGLKDFKDCIALKAIPFSEDAKVLAKQSATVYITGNKAENGGGIGANGGIQIGTESTAQVQVKKVWKGDSESQRPESVMVKLLNGSTVIDSAVLNAANGWSYTFTGLPEKGNYTIVEKPVENYTTVVSGNAADGFVITNSRNKANKEDKTHNQDDSDDPVNSPSQIDSPKTGDDSDPVLWIVLFLFGFAVLVFVVNMNIRRRKINMKKRIMFLFLITILEFALFPVPAAFAEENDTALLQQEISQSTGEAETEQEITAEQEIKTEQEITAEQTEETHPVAETTNTRSNDQNTWEVSSNEELSKALDEIQKSSVEDITIVLKQDYLEWKSPVGVPKKHVTMKSAESGPFTLTLSTESVLQGDVTLDNIRLSGKYSKIYAAGHKFETTENFVESEVDYIYGGGNKTDVEGDTNITLRGNISVNWLFGGGFDSNVKGNTNILADGANVHTGNVYGGGRAKDTASGKVSGDTNVVLKQGSNGFLMGGGMNEYSKDNAEGAREPASVTGTANVTIGYDGAPEHTMDLGTAMFAYGGSWHSTVGNVNFQMLDGAWSDKDHALRNYYGCGYCDTVRGTVNIIVDGADLSDDRVYGGGSKYNDSDTYGPVEILNEGNVPYALHISYKPSGNSLGVNAGGDFIPTTIHGDVLVEAQHGDMDFVILDNLDAGDCTINGTATVRVSGDANIAQVQGNKKHFDDNEAEKSLAVYDGCGTKDTPQKTSYLYRFGTVILQNQAQVVVDSEKFLAFESTQKPFYSVNNLEIGKDCGLTTRDSDTTLQDSVKIDSGTWTAHGNVYVYEKMESQNGHIFFNNYFAVGYAHRNKDDLTVHNAFSSKGDEFVALKSGYTGKFYGNVALDNSDLAFMCPVNVSGNWEGDNSVLRVPAVAAGENYDGTDNGGSIALNIDGTAAGKTIVSTVAADDWKRLQTPTLGDNYITGFTADQSMPVQETFILGNDEAVKMGYYLKRLEDPADEENYFMWQVAKRDSYHVLYEFKSGTADKELIQDITELLPVDSKKYPVGTMITAVQPDETTIKVSDGVWTFTGYDADKKEAVVTNADVNGNVIFTGTWVFKSSTTEKPTKPDKPEKPSKPSVHKKTEKSDIPSPSQPDKVESAQTGDSTNISFYISILVMSGLFFMFLTISKIALKNKFR